MAAGAGEHGSVTPYVPVDGGPWRLSMGLRRLDPDRWLEVDAHRAGELAKKATLLATARDAVLVTTEGSETACDELLALVRAFLSQHHPEVLDRDRPGGTQQPGPTDPLEVASMLVQEDLCVLEQRDGVWRLSAACVCFPSRWSLTEKLGCTLDEIHAPVPGFDASLSGPSTTFFDRLTTDRPAWRCNWTLLETPELHLPSAAARATVPHAVERLDDVWFRVERQTLRRLAVSGAVVFTIRTYVTALEALLASDDTFGPRLAATLRTVPDDVAAYKGWTATLGSLIEALERRGHGVGTSPN